MVKTLGRYKEITGYSTEKKTMVINASKGHQGATGTVSISNDDGVAEVDQNQSAATLIIPIEGIHAGDEINKFRVVGALGAKSSNATTVDASLYKVTKGSGSISTTEIGAISQVSTEEDTALDEEKSGLEETVASDYSYFVLVTITTADDAACDAFISGVEIDLNQ